MGGNAGRPALLSGEYRSGLVRRFAGLPAFLFSRDPSAYTTIRSQAKELGELRGGPCGPPIHFWLGGKASLELRVRVINKNKTRWN